MNRGDCETSTLRVLLIDDNPHLLHSISCFLRSHGICADTANGGREGLDVYLARPGAYDAVLVDIQMPELDGREVLRQLRAHQTCGYCPPVIAMTGSGDDLSESGFDMVLRKPQPMDCLLRVLCHDLIKYKREGV